MFESLTRVPSRPVPVLPTVREKLSSELMKEYDSLSRKHGLKDLLHNRTADIADFLVEKGVELYDYGHVVKFMTALARRAGKNLVWASLRDRHDYSAIDTGGLYSRPVPIEVLRNVDMLSTKFGAENLIFAVTDFEVPDPDPFIRVSWRGSDDHIIFGMWDEPGYTLAHTQAASELKKLTK